MCSSPITFNTSSYVVRCHVSIVILPPLPLRHSIFKWKWMFPSFSTHLFVNLFRNPVFPLLQNTIFLGGVCCWEIIFLLQPLHILIPSESVKIRVGGLIIFACSFCHSVNSLIFFPIILLTICIDSSKLLFSCTAPCILLLTTNLPLPLPLVNPLP